MWGVGGPKCIEDQLKFQNGTSFFRSLLPLGASADADKRARMQAKGQWGEGTDRFLMDFAGKTGTMKNYFAPHVVVDANILAGIRKGEESSSDSENAGVIHFPTNLRGKGH